MKNYDDVIGIDVFKLIIDAHIHKSGLHQVFSNIPKGYQALLLWTNKYLEGLFYFLCFKHT
ncbi:MAG: transposase [Ulvibacter sp.]|jgi:transposase